MTSYFLDAESFISEVKKYPELWDSRHEGNRHKNRKQRAWSGVARCFVSDLDLLSDAEKLEVYQKLNNKWRNIRDAYVRSLRRKDGRAYLYDKQLSFLSAGCNNNKSETDDEASEDDDKKNSKALQIESVSYHSDEETRSTIDNLKRRRLNKTNHCADFDETPISSDMNYQIEDEDRSFFDSLLPAVREFSLDQKLEFRTEVLQLLQMIRSSQPIIVNISSRPYE